MQVLTEMEVDQVSGSGAAKTVAKAGLLTGSAAIGAYISAARLGATLGMAAGPVGAVAGAMIGAGIIYMYYGE
jgi:hypothetical protein